MSNLRRFFIDPVVDEFQQVVLDKDQSHHCRRVVRLQAGDAVELLDGAGGLYRGAIERCDRETTVRLQGRVLFEPQPDCPLWVCQGDLKGKKMDELVQRCTELGVSRFLPFTSSRSQGRIDGERWERKQLRWRELVRSACKQSRRLRPMEVEREQSFAQRLELPGMPIPALKLLFWEEETACRLSDCAWSGSLRGVALMLGPEGGLSAAEAAVARQHGWLTVGLGRRILRAETATVAAVAIVAHLLGDI